MTKHYDAIIVGGGPAGLATGIRLAQKHLSVLICEAKQFPVDKACGEGIMPTGVRLLERLGVNGLIPEVDFFPFSGVRYISEDGASATGEFQEGTGWGMRRRVLSEKLFQLASGYRQITILPRTRILSIESKPGSVGICSGQDEFEACLLIGADGLNSFVRTRSSMGQSRNRSFRWGICAHFEMPPWTDHVEVYWSSGIEIYVTPLSATEIGVAILWDRSRYPQSTNREGLYTTFLNGFPVLKERLKNISFTGSIQSAGPFLQSSRYLAKNRILLIGDAAGYLDAITGEGISLALAEAELCSQYAADFVQKTNQNELMLARYDRQLKQMMHRSQEMTHFVLFLSRHPLLARQMIHFLSTRPWTFQFLLSYNMGTAGFLSHS